MIPGTLAVLIFMLTLPPLFAACTPQRETVKSDVGSWDPETGLGNHRAVVRVEVPPAAKAAPKAKGRGPVKPAAVTTPAVPSAVRVRIPWRRRDSEPEKKAVIVIDAAFGRTDPQRHASANDA